MAVYWDKVLPNTLRMDIPREQTWQAYNEMVDEMIRMAKSARERIDLIISREDLFQHLGATPHIRRTLDLCHQLEHLHLVVYVLPRESSFPSIIVKSVLQAFYKDSLSRFHFVEKLIEARELIYQNRDN